MPPIVGRAAIGKAVNVEVMRNNKRKTLQVKIEELPESDEIVKADSKTGRLVDDRLAIEVLDLSDEQREDFSVPEGGVVVVKVDAGSAAAAGLRRGDVILSINNHNVTDAKQFLDLANDLPEDKAIPVLVQRGEGAIFLALRIKNGEE